MPGRAGNARALARRVAPMLLGVLASALLLPVYAQGGYGWPLGFVALVPWLIALDASSSSLARALLGAWAMSIGFVVAAFAWFGSAIDAYLGIGVVPAVALLCVCARSACSAPGRCAPAPAPRRGSRAKPWSRNCSVTRSATACIRRHGCARAPISVARPG
jgi:apolipoprotein N-acyltransferase